MKISRRIGHGSRSNGRIFDLRKLPGQRDHVSRVDTAAVQQKRQSTVGAQTSHRQRHRSGSVSGREYAVRAGHDRVELFARIHRRTKVRGSFGARRPPKQIPCVRDGPQGRAQFRAAHRQRLYIRKRRTLQGVAAQQAHQRRVRLLQGRQV